MKKQVTKIELIHTSEKKFSKITFPYIEYIDTRVMIARSNAEDHKKYYDKIGIPGRYKSRMHVIYNKLTFPVDKEISRSYDGNLKVCYAGRGGYQKRIYLIVKIMEACRAMGLPVEFHLAGDYKNELSDDILKYYTFYGVIKGGDEMQRFLEGMDVLLMTSAFEGFPMVIMEAMAKGVIPVATAVDGIPEHIQNGVNGYLISEAQNEEKVVSQGIDILQCMCSPQCDLPAMSRNAFLYAKEHFNSKHFDLEYRRVMGFEP